LTLDLLSSFEIRDEAISQFQIDKV